MSAYLYLNRNGKPVGVHSYSGGSAFRSCQRKYQLGRIDGWKEKSEKASFRFGQAIETAMQSFHANKMTPGGAVEEFLRLWDKIKQLADLTYTDKEGDWDDMRAMGRDMMKLYEIKLPTWPIHNPKFQLQYRKEVFPDSELAGIDFTAYVDMRCEKKLPAPSSQPEALILDIKTSATTLNEDIPNLISLDPQLRAYAWVTGIPDVGFLWFTKTKPGFKKGDEITCLTDCLALQRGDPGIILAGVNEFGSVAVLTPKDYQQFEATAKGLRGKKLDECKRHFEENCAVLLKDHEVTKQRVQLVTTHISEEDMREAGELIGQEIVEIVASRQRGSFPKNPGIRFPDNKCMMCSMLGICTKNDKLRDEKLFQIGAWAAPVETDWIDDLEAA